jgi:hypothetical protein
MRAFFAGILVLLISGACFAQADREVQPITNSGIFFQVTPSARQNLFRMRPVPLFSNLPDEPSTEAAKARAEGILRPDVGCFTMRTYQFSHGPVGSAPKLMGYTDCVPSRSLELRQTAPKARFVPQ